MKLKLIFLFLFLAVSCGGCGIKGPPLPPLDTMDRANNDHLEDKTQVTAASGDATQNAAAAMSTDNTKKSKKK
jgi:predicted small lipoprotein YifL